MLEKSLGNTREGVQFKSTADSMAKNLNLSQVYFKDFINILELSISRSNTKMAFLYVINQCFTLTKIFLN